MSTKHAYNFKDRTGMILNTNLGLVKVLNYRGARDYDLLLESGETITGHDFRYLENNLIVKMPNKNSFKSKCKKANVNEGTALKCRKKYNLSDEEAIDMALKMKKPKLKSIAEKYNLSIHIIRNEYRKIKGTMTIEEFDNYIRQKTLLDNRTAKERCEEDGIKYHVYIDAKRKHPELTDYESIIKYIKEQKRYKEYLEKAKKLGINNGYIKRKSKELNINYLDNFDYLLNLCLDNSQKRQHALDNMSNLRKLCNLANIDFEKAKAYYYRCNEIKSFNEVIIYFRPDCYINILGELVIPDKEDKEQ